MRRGYGVGHALVVGVGQDLPNTINDAKGIHEILTDESRCAYPAAQVQLCTGSQATRKQILDGLARLSKLDADASVIVYFSGHGYQVNDGDGAEDGYYLMPYGYDTGRLNQTAVSGGELTGALRNIKAGRLLLLLDCCHAGGMANVKSPKASKRAAPSLTKAPMPAEVLQVLSEGKGRFIIASSKKDELSYAGKPYSAFTLALIEALCGKGTSQEDGYVYVADLAAYTIKMVPRLTRNRQNPTQDFKETDNFAVAYYAGSETKAKALPETIAKPQIEDTPGAQDFQAAEPLAQRWQIIGQQIINSQAGFINNIGSVNKVIQIQGNATFYENDDD
ncbi:MAG: hypothetical protein QOH70_2048 [Blastocatellia bacterium]|jgi:uncharacterized caspase-like protein|nr:hypothetical protein [Blastocatellia bacterium]